MKKYYYKGICMFLLLSILTLYIENVHAVVSSFDSNSTNDQVLNNNTEEKIVEKSYKGSEEYEIRNNPDGIENHKVSRSTFESDSATEAYHDFSPPSSPGGGYYLMHSFLDSNADTVVKKVIETYLIQKLTIGNDETLGANKGDSMVIKISSKQLHHYLIPIANNPATPYVSIYGYVEIGSLSASSISSSLDIKTNKVNDGFEIEVTRMAEEMKDSYDVEIDCDFIYPYYTSAYYTTGAGYQWSAWKEQPSSKLSNQKQSINIKAEPKVEELTAVAISQEVDLGIASETLSEKTLVKDVKFGSTILSPNEYTVSMIESPDLLTVGEKKAKVKVTYKEEDVDVEIPVKVNWGSTVHLKGGYSQSAIGLSLLKKGSDYQIVASKGQGSNGGGIHETSGTYFGIETYSLSNFNNQVGNNLEQNYSVNIDGRESKNTAYQLIQSPLTVKLGDVLKVYHKQITSYPGLIELYNNSSQQPNPNGDLHMKNNNLYLQITEDGFKVLNFNQLESKSVSIPIYSTQEYLEEHIEDYIDLKGYKNLSVKEFSQYPNTKSSGTQKGKIIVEELLSTGKKVQYEYEVTFTIQEGELTLSAPKILDFQDFSKSKLEQLVQRKKIADLGLSVKDSRGDGKQGGWRVTARVNQSEELAPYLIFRDDNTEDQYLNQGAVEIYSQSKQGESVEPINVEVSGEWTKDTGILLKVPSKNNLSSEKYTSTITWNLVEGP